MLPRPSRADFDGRRSAAAMLLFAAWITVAACQDGADREPEPAPASDTAAAVSPAPAAAPAAQGGKPARDPTGALGALSAAKRLEVRLALLDVNKALILYHMENDRYPADQRELESDPALAGSIASLKGMTRGLSYASEGSSYKITVTRVDGVPMSVSGGEPGPRGGAPSGGSGVVEEGRT